MKKKYIKFIIIGIILITIIGITVTFLLIRFNKKETKPKEITYSKATPLLYKVSDEDSSIYLLGSIHYADDSAYEFNQNILDIYTSSDALAVEFDLLAFEKDFDKQLEMVKNYLYLDGTTIEDHIDEKLYEKLVNLLKEKKLYNKAYNVYNITFWESLVSEAIYEDANLDANKGIDMYFLNKAYQDKKKIIEVESLEFQMNLENELPEDYVLYSLEEMLDNYDEGIKEIKTLYETWKKGDEEEFTSLLIEEDNPENVPDYLKEDAEKYNKMMVTDRNISMADVMEENLQNNTEVFCVVGAAHVIGDEGIASLLKNRGYTVEKVNYA